MYYKHLKALWIAVIDKIKSSMGDMIKYDGYIFVCLFYLFALVWQFKNIWEFQLKNGKTECIIEVNRSKTLSQDQKEEKNKIFSFLFQVSRDNKVTKND